MELIHLLQDRHPIRVPVVREGIVAGGSWDALMIFCPAM
jgi:hypothetical protein